jgi:hypothetical protein
MPDGKIAKGRASLLNPANCRALRDSKRALDVVGAGNGRREKLSG